MAFAHFKWAVLLTLSEVGQLPLDEHHLTCSWILSLSFSNLSRSLTPGWDLVEGCDNYTGKLSLLLLWCWYWTGMAKKTLTADLENYQDPDHRHSPFHVDPQENVGKEKEGDDQWHGLDGVPDFSAPGWQGQIHNHQHKVH